MGNSGFCLCTQDDRGSCSFQPQQLVEDSRPGLDRSVVLLSVKQDWRTFEQAGDAMRADPDCLLQIMKQDPEEGWRTLQFATLAVRQDRRVVLEAVGQSGLALAWAAEALRGDLEVVLAAVKKDAAALSYATALLLSEQPGLHLVPQACERLPSVLSSRFSMAAGGRVSEEEGGLCVASYPGAYLQQWEQLVPPGSSSACVFLPKGDSRYGQHACPDAHSDKCWCYQLYGEEKAWGCAWFPAWLENVALAVGRRQRLLVVHFPYGRDEGHLDWEDLSTAGEELWDGRGLGGSQKAECAWLAKHHPDLVEHLELLELAQRLDVALDSLPSEVLAPISQPGKGDRVLVTAGMHSGKKGKIEAAIIGEPGAFCVRFDSGGDDIVYTSGMAVLSRRKTNTQSSAALSSIGNALNGTGSQSVRSSMTGF